MKKSYIIRVEVDEENGNRVVTAGSESVIGVGTSERDTIARALANLVVVLASGAYELEELRAPTSQCIDGAHCRAELDALLNSEYVATNKDEIVVAVGDTEEQARRRAIEVGTPDPYIYHKSSKRADHAWANTFAEADAREVRR